MVVYEKKFFSRALDRKWADGRTNGCRNTVDGSRNVNSLWLHSQRIEMNINGFMLTGENCLVGDQVIAGYGLDIILPHGNCDKSCRCPGEETYTEQGENTQAICTPLC